MSVAAAVLVSAACGSEQKRDSGRSSRFHHFEVWFQPVQPRQAADFRIQRYRRKPVLTWWEGTQPTIGIGSGKFAIVDDAYRRIAEVRAGNGLEGDLHEFLITPRNTALLLAYERVPHDLSAIGGRKNGCVFDCVVQEVEVETGRVLFQWRSLGHVPVAESIQRIPAREASAKKPFDYFHANSIELDGKGNLLVSARTTNAVYAISRRDGSPVETRRPKQRLQDRAGGTLRLAARRPPRARRDNLDLRQQRPPQGRRALTRAGASPRQGGEGRVLCSRIRASAPPALPAPGQRAAPGERESLRRVGGKPYLTEFSASGQVLFDARLAAGDSYRAYRFEWTGHPAQPPAVAAEAGEGDSVLVYASWNGATEVEAWEVLAGDGRDELRTIATARKDGFETEIAVRTDTRYVAVRALDGAGRTLRTSKAVEPTDRMRP